MKIKRNIDERPTELLKNGVGENLPKLRRVSTRQKILHKKKVEYSRSFAIHGLSRVFHGTRIEKFFWLLNLVLSFGISAFLIRSQVKSYFNKDIYIEERRISTPTLEFPTVTLCTRDPIKYQYCKKDAAKFLRLFPGIRDPCKHKLDITQNGITTNYPPGDLKFDIPTFKIKCGVNCDFFKDIYAWRGISNYTNCVQFNGNRLELSTDRIGFRMSLAKNIKQRDFHMYIHSSEDTPYILNHGSFEVSSLQNTNLRIKTIKTKRLEDPFPSKCVSVDEGKRLNIFPGRYSIQACSESLKCIKTFKLCGDTFDFCRRYIPEDIRLKYQNKNVSIQLTHMCLTKHIKHNLIGQCRQPCDQLEYDVQISPRPHWKKTHGYAGPAALFVEEFDLTFVLTEPGSFLQREEKEMFSWTDLLGLVGGTIGLFCGFSFLSFLELIIYLAIKIIVKRDVEEEQETESNKDDDSLIL
eukprot:TCONS_00033765-protein